MDESGKWVVLTPSSPSKSSSNNGGGKVDQAINKIVGSLARAGSRLGGKDKERGGASSTTRTKETERVDANAKVEVQGGTTEADRDRVVVPPHQVQAQEPARGTERQEEEETVVLSLQTPSFPSSNPSQPPQPTPPTPVRSDTGATITPVSHAASSAQPTTTVNSSGGGGGGGGATLNLGEVVVPKEMQEGMTMLKVSAKKIQQRTFKLDGEKGTIEWGSKKGGFGECDERRRTRRAVYVFGLADFVLFYFFFSFFRSPFSVAHSPLLQSTSNPSVNSD